MLANRTLLFDRLVIITVLLCGLYLISVMEADPDLWGHVQYGLDWIRDGEMPRTTTYSYTAQGYRWINHENIPELAMGASYQWFGSAGLIGLRLIAGLSVLSIILFYNLRSNVSLVASSAITIVVASNLAIHFVFRPQVASIVCFTLMMLLLQLSFAGWRDKWQFCAPALLRKWANPSSPPITGFVQADLGYDSGRLRLLWLMPLVISLWTNSHGGFLAGVVIYAVYLGLRTMEAVVVRRRRSWGLVRRMALMLAAAMVATLINPYSWELLQWIVYSVGTPRPEIADWSNKELFSENGLRLWLMMGMVVVSMAFSRNEKDFTQLVITVLVFAVAIRNFRHAQFAAVLVGFWTGPHLDSVLERLNRWTAKRSLGGNVAVKPMQPRLLQLAGAGSVVILLTVAVVNRNSEIHVDRNRYPIDAVQFMSENNLYGRTVVSFNWAQYYIAAMCVPGEDPQRHSLVSIDGRFRTCYPQELIDSNFDFSLGEGNGVRRYRSDNSGPCDPEKILWLDNPELVLTRRFKDHGPEILRQKTDEWTLLYQDQVAEVWGKKEIFDRPDSSRYVALSTRSLSNDSSIQGFVRWPALPTGNRLSEYDLAAPAKLVSRTVDGK